MEISQIIPHVEALIFAADRPLPLQEIVDLLNNALAFLEDRTNPDQVETALEAIKEKYSSEFYAFEVRHSGGGYQFLTKKDYYQTVAQLNGDKFLKRLSTAALETLAIIAYRQPISKAEIEYIRGVSTDYSIQKLLEKELIVITGRSEDQPGKPLLYAVSRSFMDYFGIASVADLPKLKELFDEETVQPTLIKEDADATEAEKAAHHALMVSENGELLDPDHQLDELAENDPDLASEDEDVEPDDEIVRFDDIIEEANEEAAENTEASGEAGDASFDPLGDEDADDIVEDALTPPQEDDEDAINEDGDNAEREEDEGADEEEEENDEDDDDIDDDEVEEEDDENEKEDGDDDEGNDDETDENEDDDGIDDDEVEEEDNKNDKEDEDDDEGNDDEIDEEEDDEEDDDEVEEDNENEEDEENDDDDNEKNDDDDSEKQ